jgi:hypothetical protein
MFEEELHPDIGIVSGKPFTGWQEHDEPFLRVAFHTRGSMRRAGDLFRRRKLGGKMFDACPAWFARARLAFETYELDADLVVHALTSRGVPPTGWVRAPGRGRVDRKGGCEVEYEGVPVPVPDDEVPDAAPPHVIATFDIECLSSRSTWEDQIFRTRPSRATSSRIPFVVPAFPNRRFTNSISRERQIKNGRSRFPSAIVFFSTGRREMVDLRAYFSLGSFFSHFSYRHRVRMSKQFRMCLFGIFSQMLFHRLTD